MSDDKTLPAASKSADVDAFLTDLRRAPAVRPGGRGRLIFALDATASREPTWDRACRIQGEMFEATAALGGLDVKLVFYRGFAECKASRWMASAAELHRAMNAVSCIGGETQIERVLDHALAEMEKIVDLLIGTVNDTMKQTRFSIVLRPEVRKWIVDKTCHDRSYGARPLRRAIQKYIEDPLSEAIIQHRFKPDSNVEIYLHDDNLYYLPSGESVESGVKLGI